ncbi:sigma-70 family RNA polymerase sigma factor [Paenarthrobacter sp.]|uniref:RNA polymerase sigma factor n=1 Tax=Paenarthrobacter sp. TaxID=1931993 RepID=UPI002811D89F|nr:sigma-70 family RNA polymerase sigma factor [Paenarthrobacter sp.]
MTATALGTVSDADLVLRVRSGDQGAFASLFDRHRDMARYVAAGQVDNRADIEDIVSEAFVSIHQALMRGKGPDTFFRAYLLTAVRRIAQAQNRMAARSLPVSDNFVLDRVEDPEDPAVVGFESSTVAAAFKSLPVRWQEVLWYVDIEGMKPAAASEVLGITPNGVSSLAIRAREGLRQAYLQGHIKDATGQECQGYPDQLGAYSRNGLSRRAHHKVQVHLESCSKCTALLLDLNDVQSAMRAIIFPLIAGVALTSAAPGITGITGITGTAGLAGAGGIAGAGVGDGTAPRSVAAMVKVGAAGLTGAAIIVGATIALAGTGPNTPGTPQAGEGPVSTSTHDNQNTKSPLTGTTPAPAAPSTQPSKTPSHTAEKLPAGPEELRTGPEDFPALNGVQGSPAGFLVPPHRPVAWPAPPPAAPPTTPAALPALPGADTTPDPTPSPSPTQTPSPTPTRPTAPEVTATVTTGAGSNAADVQATITFTIAGQETAETAEVVFSVSEGASLIPGKLLQPAGWSCTAQNDDGKEVRCTKTAVDPGNLQFTLGISRKDPASPTTLNYQFTGTGLPSTTFSDTF